ncbi:MAG: hypothetical protein KDI92_11420 [Xanthomonadales bacterium]|nr:hypothetical protein [Xanthomonadales bacterium]
MNHPSHAKKDTSHRLQSRVKNTSDVLSRLSPLQLALWLFTAAVLVQLPLLFNAGYFSHDELQWASRADVSHWQDLPWNHWLGFGVYQYRPLTFNLWLLISYGCFDHPYFFHGLFVFWGAFNAVLLMIIGRYCAVGVHYAFVGALLFVLNPYAVYVHGWVATLADLLVMSSTLLLLLVILKSSNLLYAVIASTVFTLIGLLSKESAFAIPAILGVIWLFDHRRSRWLLSVLASSSVTLLYLYIRFETLMQPDAAQYAMNPLNPPLRWLEYHWYWLILNSIEPHSLFERVAHHKLILAGVTFILLLWACWRTEKKCTLLLLAAGLATLLPVLPISYSSGQYGYLFSAAVVMLMSYFFQKSKGWKKHLMLFVALISILHGLKVMREIRIVGEVQNTFSPALAKRVANHQGQFPIHLKVAEDAKKYIFVRLTKDIHSYQAVSIGDRVKLVEQGEDADYVILADGRIINRD